MPRRQESNLTISFGVPIGHDGLSPNEELSNTSFFTPGSGGSDVFANWVEFYNNGPVPSGGSADSVIITQATDEVHTGTYSCKMQSNVNADDFAALLLLGEGGIYQQISVSPGASYSLSLYSRTSGGFSDNQGRFAIYDVTNAAWIIPMKRTGVFPASYWGFMSEIFTVPATCSSIQLYLYQNINFGTSVWYDDVAIRSRNVITSAPVPEWSETGNIGSYKHTSSVNMGYDNMSVTSFGDLGYMSDWMENGLARHVVVKGWAGEIVWEGFVNEVSAQLGGLTLTIGPLMDIVNRGRMVYKDMDWSTTPPIAYGTVRAQWRDNLDSQSKLSVLEGVITGGEGDSVEMDQLIDTVINDTAWPEVTQNVALGSTGNMAMTINCLGYGHMLNKYFYSQAAFAGNESIADKIQAILAADPNAIFSSSNIDLEENDAVVHRYEDADRTSLAVLKEMVAMGDSEFNRFVFGVFAGHTFRMWNATAREVKYYQSVTDGRLTIADGSLVQPWEVLPGEWMFMSDLVPGKPSNVSNYRHDQRFVFIESVTYTAPYGLSISGGRASKFKQRIDKLGLGGI